MLDWSGEARQFAVKGAPSGWTHPFVFWDGASKHCVCYDAKFGLFSAEVSTEGTPFVFAQGPVVFGYLGELE